MEIHAAVVTATDSSEERHTVLCRAIASTHNVRASSRGRGAVYDRDAPRGVFAPVISDVQSDDGGASTWRRTLHDDDLGNLPILPEVLVGAKGRNELP